MLNFDPKCRFGHFFCEKFQTCLKLLAKGEIDLLGESQECPPPPESVQTPLAGGVQGQRVRVGGHPPTAILLESKLVGGQAWQNPPTHMGAPLTF